MSETASMAAPAGAHRPVYAAAVRAHWLTTKEAGRALGVTDRMARHLAAHGQVDGWRLEGRWLISRLSVVDYQAQRTRGRRRRAS